MHEIERQKKVLSMMVSMHSNLRDSYRGNAFIIELFLLLSAVFLNALVFFNFEEFDFLPIGSDYAKLNIGILSVAVFAISVVMLLVNWKEKAANHDLAAKELSKLLQQAREIIEDKNGINNSVLLNNFNERYKSINNIVISIPESQFNRLKSKHLRKVELSKFISQYPKLPFWMLKIKFLYCALVKKQN